MAAPGPMNGDGARPLRAPEGAGAAKTVGPGPATGSGRRDDPLPGGWYLVRVRGAGGMPRPGLVVDPPEAWDVPMPLPLAPVAADGVAETVIVVTDGFRAVNLVAGPAGGTVDGEPIELRRIGRGEAVRRMLAAVATHAPGRLPGALAGLAWRAVAGGPAAAGAQLVRLYRNVVRHAAGWPPQPAGTVPMRVRRRRAGGIEILGWRPAPGLDGDGAVWRSDDADPQFHLWPAVLGERLPAGWYRFDYSLDGRRRLHPPELYPDYGAGIGSDSRIVLPAPGADGRGAGWLRLRAPAAALRFDPVAEAGDFRFDDSALRRVGRLALAWGLLSEQRDARGRRDWPRIAGLAARALLHGREAGQWLLSECQPEGLLADASATLPVRVRSRAWGPASIRRRFVAANHLRGDRDDEGAWEAFGEDPQFLLAGDALPRPLRAGWYLFRCRIGVRSGQVISPCFYPDYGQGFRAEDLILVPDPEADGEICTLVLFKFDVHALRFDPSLRRCRFTLDGMSLTRLGRPAAFLRMLDGIRDESGRRLWPAAASAAGGFMLELRKGPSAGAALLFDRYQHHCRQGSASYDAWVRLHDTLTASDVDALRAEAAAMPRRPLVSILVPVYQTPERWLRRCLESVLAQAYPDWELCIAEDASPSERVREVLREYERRDPRIRVTYRETNGHIAEASNTALAMARGEYVGLLDHDDELRPHALLEMMRHAVANPSLRILYSDEDKIDAAGRRFQPYFKPDWNPDLLLGQNYLCHFSVLHTDTARAAGGFRTGFEGSQDHDLLLRCSERVGPDQIRHVPKVLYHWRAIEGSTALRRDAKDYAADAGARAVAEHLQRTGADATVEQLPHGHYRVHWALPTPAPRVTIVIPTRDRVDLLRTCIDSVLERTRYPDFRILVVDNGSVEPATLAYLDALRRDGRATVLRDDLPFNYARLNNAAVAACDGELVALLNNDIEVISPDWLEEMAGQALRPGVGAVGAMLYYPDDTIQHAGVILGIGGVANHAYIRQLRGCPGHGGRAKVAQALSAVTGACLVVRRDTYLAVGGLDERLQVAFNDVDFCLRLRERGLRNLWTPFAELYHHESASRGREDSAEKLARFHGEVRQMEARWGHLLAHDPAYNPNLSLDSFNFDLAFPPRHVPAA